jgi:hypothetical protein
MPKVSRYTLGTKIDTHFIETTELILLAGYASREQKAALLRQASSKFDMLKFFLQIAWELKVIDSKRYITLARPLVEIGKMIGGWRKQLTNEAPTH